MTELELLKKELEQWKEISNKGHLIRQKTDGTWYVESSGVVLPVIYKEAKDAFEDVKKLIKASKPPLYKATVLYNEGYGKQCKEIEPFEAKSKEHAQELARLAVETIFGENPKVDVIEIKITKIPL
jgi:hypothetical protein